MLKVGVAGCGTIGAYLIKEIFRRYRGEIDLCGVCEPQPERIKSLEKVLAKKLRSVTLEVLFRTCDLVIEAANTQTAAETLCLALKYRKKVMIMSVGGLLLNPGLVAQARRANIGVFVPSGAIAGIDALKAAAMGKIKSVTITTEKPLAGLKDAPYVKKHKLDLQTIKKQKVIFEGTARQAVKNFPQNINVAAVLSLAGIGAQRTRVRLVASALVKRNIHTIAIEGDFGKIISRTENVPSPLNPKTSTLAVLSALANLDGILHEFKVGT